MKRLLFIIILLNLLIPASRASENIDRAAELGHQYQALSKVTTPSDSVPVLYNIFDLSLPPEKEKVGLTLIQTAIRARKLDVAGDVIRTVAPYYNNNDSILNMLLAEAGRFPESAMRHHTETFVKIIINGSKLRYATTSDVKSAALHDLMEKLEGTPPSNLYERIVLLHAVCSSMAEFPEDNFFRGYIDQLNELADQLPGTDVSLRNYFYNNAAASYTRGHIPARAVFYDQKLLQSINEMETQSHNAGRKFRTFGPEKYLVYTRLLENFEALTPHEIEEFHAKAIELAHTDPMVKKQYEQTPMPDIYYNIYHKNYAKALQLLKDHVEIDKISYRFRNTLELFIKAASEVGDTQTLLKAYPRSLKLMQDYINARSTEKHAVLQAVYDMNQMKGENMRLVEERQRDNRARWRIRTLIMVVTLIVLFVFVVILYRERRNAWRLAKKLETSNKELESERKNLLDAQRESARARDQAVKADQLKTDFINNMSHEVKGPLEAVKEYAYLLAESIDDHKKKYLMQFADMLTLNADMVNTIVNDVLQLSELHNSSIKVEKKIIYAGPVCESAIDSVRSRIPDGVKLEYIPMQPDMLLNVDRYRLIQILVNLLQNAAKFTEEGYVKLYYRPSFDGRNLEFIVEDTGIGIMPENAERIFERFVKLNSSSQGIGLGLTISRMLARLMGGDIGLDRSYTDGARFIVTLPID